MESSVCATLAFPGKPLARTLLLIKSLRKFGGSWAEIPVWILHPSSQGAFSGAELAQLQGMGGKTLAFEADEEILRFPLGTKVQAAAAAEAWMEGNADQLVWFDSDTLILSPLDEFALSGKKVLAYRPVHHQLLGIGWGAPLDSFWELIYQRCGASSEADFMMTTHVGEEIRPYFNAGCYAVRPEKGILRKWEEVFLSSYQEPALTAHYAQNGLYAVFAHQALLSGVLLANLKESELQALSPAVNYPLHLHHEIPPALRAGRIDDLVTVRYENLLDKADWQMGFSLSQELVSWIETQRTAYFRAGERL